MLFYKLSENFDLSSEVEQHLHSLDTVTTTSTTNFVNNIPLPILNGTLPVWQFYERPANILFLRNWQNDIFRSHTILKLTALQHYIAGLPERNELINAFLNIEFDKLAVGVVKVIGDVDAHVDVTRKYAITIGLKNSNYYRTYASYENISKECMFDYNTAASYIINDGDVYITKVDTLHAVRPIQLANCPERLTLTYSIKG